VRVRTCPNKFERVYSLIILHSDQLFISKDTDRVKILFSFLIKSLVLLVSLV